MENPNASIVADNRVIFNIKGNAFRLVTSVNYRQLAAYVIWFGTHKEYDKIDTSKISFDIETQTLKANNMNRKVIKTKTTPNQYVQLSESMAFKTPLLKIFS
jgi:hypothetical protein